MRDLDLSVITVRIDLENNDVVRSFVAPRWLVARDAALEALHIRRLRRRHDGGRSLLGILRDMGLRLQSRARTGPLQGGQSMQAMQQERLRWNDALPQSKARRPRAVGVAVAEHLGLRANCVSHRGCSRSRCACDGPIRRDSAAVGIAVPFRDVGGRGGLHASERRVSHEVSAAAPGLATLSARLQSDGARARLRCSITPAVGYQRIRTKRGGSEHR
jgi:hypothetical protein